MPKQDQKKKDIETLYAALRVLKRHKAHQKCAEYGFSCAQCNLGIMYEMFESYVNFWLD